MGVGIYNKLKKSFKAIGQRISGFAKRAINAIPKVVDVGKKVIGAVSPILSTAIPGAGPVLNAINRGLDYADRIGKGLSAQRKLATNQQIGRSLIPELE